MSRINNPILILESSWKFGLCFWVTLQTQSARYDVIVHVYSAPLVGIECVGATRLRVQIEIEGWNVLGGAISQTRVLASFDLASLFSLRLQCSVGFGMRRP